MITPDEYQEGALKTESLVTMTVTRGVQAGDGTHHTKEATINSRALHAVMGLVTETGELMDVFKKGIFYGKEYDSRQKILDEGGDVCWYLAILFDSVGLKFADVMEANLAKLRARYGNKFSAERAINRDLEAENAALHDKLDDEE